MLYVISVALTLGSPWGGFTSWDQTQPAGLQSSGGWPGQVHDFNQFLPPAITSEHRLTADEQWYVDVFFRETRLGSQIFREMPRRPELLLPPPPSVLRSTGQDEGRPDSAPWGLKVVLPAVAGWKMLHVDVTDTDHLLLDLADPDERVRLASVKRLGRLKLLCAVDALAATLREDPSGVVREAAARALTVIGAASALPALQQAADSDTDQGVRRTALFAVEILESRDWPTTSDLAAPTQNGKLDWRYGGFFN